MHSHKILFPFLVTLIWAAPMIGQSKTVAERLGFGKPASAELHHPRDLRRGRNQLPAFVVTHYHRALDMVGPGWLPGHGGAGSFVRH